MRRLHLVGLAGVALLLSGCAGFRMGPGLLPDDFEVMGSRAAVTLPTTT